MLMLVTGWSVPASAKTRNVLLLSADSHTAPGLVEVEAALRRVLFESVPETELHVEHLDFSYATVEMRQMLVTLLRARYAERRPEVVIPFGLQALKFLMAEKQFLFPDAAVVFAHVQPSDIPALALPKSVAGVIFDWNFDEQLDTALGLLPETRRAVLVLGSGPIERSYEPMFRRDFARFQNRVVLDWWIGMPLAEMERRAASLPPHTVIVFLTMYRDNAGGNVVPMFAADTITSRANAPVFSPFSHYIGRGIVGDGRVSTQAVGTALGVASANILRGASAESVGVHNVPTQALRFDARALDRWNIPHSRLPAGSEVLFHEVSLWDQHRAAALIAIAVIVAQALLLAALIAQRVARRRAELSEIESQRLHKAVIDALEERIATIAYDGTIVAANRAWVEFARMQGRAAALGIGNNYLTLIRRAVERGREDARRTMESLAAVLSGRESARRLAYFSPVEGESWRYDMKIVSLQNSEKGAIVTIQDVTDRWRAEERVRVTLESMPVATILLDSDGDIELVNEEAERLFGYHRGELLGRSLLPIIPALVRDVTRWVDGGEFSLGPLIERGSMARRKDGSEVPVHVHLRTVALGTRRVALASILDLTERRRLDSEMQKMREEAIHFARVAVLGEMSAAIAHELNQPLTGILSNCQAAQISFERNSYTREDIGEMFGDIAADARRAGEVIQRLRLMLRKAPVEAKPVDINEMARQVMRLVSHDLALRGTALDLELAEGLPTLTGDRVHLQQVILNLVLNGADAMATVPLEARRILLRTVRGANRTVELEVRDAGTGISPEALEHMFEPFFTTKASGMGMGLSIVRSIVEYHGGRITCANAASGGAVFTVILPAVIEKEAA